MKVQTQTPVIASRDEYAQRWGVSSRTIAKWQSLGMPIIKPSERLIRINVQSADEWLARRFQRGEPV